MASIMHSPSRMEILRTHLKPEHGAAMRQARVLHLEAGWGIQGDCNAKRHSPRQALLASAPVYEALGIPPQNLRENLLVSGRIEELVSGQLLRIGTDAVVRLTILCEPCVKLNRVRPGLAREILGCRGYLARVIAGGEVRPGDPVVPLSVQVDPLPAPHRDRVYHLLRRIPLGRVVGLKRIVQTLGLQRTFVRVLPRFLKGAPDGVPVHRVVTTEGELLARHLPDQPRLLQCEGVEIGRDGVVAEPYLWDTEEYFTDSERAALATL